MTTLAPTEAKETPTPKPTRKRAPRQVARAPRPKTASPETRRIAAAILEVLAGGRTPGEAASALGVSLARYYTLEARALEGFVDACAPRTKGRQASPARELETLRKAQDKLQGELSRKQALLRAAQRAVGLSLPPPKPAKGRRRRKPVVRALRAAAVLRSDEPSGAVAPDGGTAHET